MTNASGRTVVHDREEQRVTGHCRELTRAIDARVQDGLSLEFGALANVATMAQGAGGMFAGATAVSPGVYVYQITDTGLAATLAVAGTRFFKDADMD